MKFKCLLLVFTAVFLSNVVSTNGENDIKGMFPYMAFIYYSDESVVDTSGSRFFRGAVLISKDWLVTSAVQISDDANDVAFPRKTLLARLGAVNVDAKFTLNEDEDEQEREIIQIVRPYNHSATQWWRTDITLMKTLLHFNLTAAVNVAPISYNIPSKKPCFVLGYARRFGNTSEERILVQSSVELLPPSIANCGSHFFEETMTCASGAADNKNGVHETRFCQGFKGGPLICDASLVALQTYIDNCKAPHLYQLLSPWMQFMECATKNKCDQIECADLCVITNKDSPLILESTQAVSTHETSMSQDISNVTITQETTTETSSETSDVPSESAILVTQTTAKEVTEETHDTTNAEVATISTFNEDLKLQPVSLASGQPTIQPPTTLITQPSILPSTQPPTRPRTQPSTQSPTEPPLQPSMESSGDFTQQRSWPKERNDSQKMFNAEECEDENRKTKVEAQQDARKALHHAKPPRQPVHHGAAERNVYNFKGVLCIFVLAGFF